MFYKDTHVNDLKRGGYRKNGSCICTVLIITHLLCICFYSSAFANSAEPPGFTIIVLNSSENL